MGMMQIVASQEELRLERMDQRAARARVTALENVASKGTPFVKKLIADEGFRALDFDFRPRSATELDAKKMTKILELPVVKGDVGTFVTEAMIDSKLSFAPDAQAKMVVMGALGQANATAAAEAFATAFAGDEKPEYLMEAFRAGQAGKELPTYKELAKRDAKANASDFSRSGKKAKTEPGALQQVENEFKHLADRVKGKLGWDSD